MTELIRMELPLRSELLTTVRLATGGICSLAGLDLDASEDCKVCVTESLLLLLHAGHAAVRISCTEEGTRLSFLLEGSECAEADPVFEDEISEALLTALAADTLISREGGRIVRVRFSFGRE